MPFKFIVPKMSCCRLGAIRHVQEEREEAELGVDTCPRFKNSKNRGRAGGTAQSSNQSDHFRWLAPPGVEPFPSWECRRLAGPALPQHWASLWKSKQKHYPRTSDLQNGAWLKARSGAFGFLKREPKSLAEPFVIISCVCKLRYLRSGRVCASPREHWVWWKRRVLDL